MTLWRNVKNIEKQGQVITETKGYLGDLKLEEQLIENIETVREVLERNPRGVRCRRGGTGISKTSFQRIATRDLRWHPYKMKIRRRRVEFSNWFIERCRDRFLANLIIGDETSFRMNGEVNTQNVQEYTPRGNAPIFYYDRNDCRAKITVWVGLCENGSLTGPFFFEGNVNGENYLQVLNEEVVPQLVEMFGNRFENGTFQRLWWAQDGTPGNRAREVRNWLLEFFQHKVIALYHESEKAKNHYRSGCSETKSNACAKICEGHASKSTFGY